MVPLNVATDAFASRGPRAGLSVDTGRDQTFIGRTEPLEAVAAAVVVALGTDTAEGSFGSVRPSGPVIRGGVSVR